MGLAVALAATGTVAAERAKAEPTFRLLELDGRTVRWTVPDRGLPPTVTYAFLSAPATFPGARNCDAMLPPEAALQGSAIDPAAFRREARAAFSLWEEAANIVFKEVAVADAGILIGADAKARGRAFTNVALKTGTRESAGNMGAISQSLICLNPEQPWKIGFDGDLEVYDLRFTLAHEIGHAIGLDHPSPEGQLMSYRYVEKGRELEPGDIAGALALYGRKGAAAPRAARGPVAPAASPAGASDRAFGLGARDVTGEPR